jgi:hypothetical protein
MAQTVSIQNEDINSIVVGGSVALTTASTTNYYNIYSSSATTISGAISVAADTAPTGFALFSIMLGTTFTLGGAGSFTMFGQAVAQSYLQAGTTFIVLYNGSSYTVCCQPSFLTTGFILGTDIASGTIALDRLVNLTAGQIVVGSASNIPTAVAMSGDATISNAGVVTIGNSKILNVMLASGIDGGKLSSNSVPLSALVTTVQNQLNTMAAQSLATASAPISSADVLTLYSSPINIVAAPGAGLALQAVDGVAWVDYNTIPYTTNVGVDIITDTATTAQLRIAVLLNTTTSTPRNFSQVAAPVNAADTQLIPNKALNITVPVGNPAAGNSPLNYIVFYRTLTVA